jgi:inosose dehydratase
MNDASRLSRRGFVGGSLAAVAASPWLAASAPAVAAAGAAGADTPPALKLGVATYSFIKFPLDATLKALQRVGVHYVSVKDAHLPLKSTAAERKEVAAKFRAAGITPLSCGVITTNDDEAEIRHAFEYARDFGVPTIVGKPTRASLPLLDRLVKEYDIRLAIHNHGPEDKVWPSPLDVWEAIQKYDERIGLCIDVGHTARCKVDPAQAIRTCAARLYDLHIKDIEGPGGKPGAAIEVGRGVLDEQAILKALLDIKFTHHVGLEFEKDLNDPLPGVAESLGYLRGVLAMLTA